MKMTVDPDIIKIIERTVKNEVSRPLSTHSFKNIVLP